MGAHARKDLERDTDGPPRSLLKTPCEPLIAYRLAAYPSPAQASEPSLTPSLPRFHPLGSFKVPHPFLPGAGDWGLHILFALQMPFHSPPPGSQPLPIPPTWSHPLGAESRCVSVMVVAVSLA